MSIIFGSNGKRWCYPDVEHELKGASRSRLLPFAVRVDERDERSARRARRSS